MPTKQAMVIEAPTARARGAALAPTIAAKATWRDWAGPETLEPDPSELLTRDELVTRLQGEGLKVTSHNLLSWQSRGFLPYPTKQRIGRASYAYYAPWVVDLVRELRRLQGEGKSLTEIRAHLLGMAQGRTGISHPLEATAGSRLTGQAELGVDVSAADTGQIRGKESASIVVYPETQTRTATNVTAALVAAPKGLTHIATAIARMYEEQFGTRIARVEIGMTDENGTPFSFVFLMSD